MIILFEGDGEHQQGMAAVLEHCGHDVRYWRRGVSELDAFFFNDPDVFVGTKPSRWIGSSKFFAMDHRLTVDTFKYQQGSFDPRLQCDIAYVGPVPDKQTYQLICELAYPGSGRHICIFSDESWPCFQVLGGVSLQTELNIYASAKLSICDSSTGSNHALRIVAAGGTPYIAQWGTNEIDEMVDMDDKERKEAIFIGQRIVKTSLSYWNRVHEMFMSVNMKAEAQLVEEQQREVLGL